MAKALHSYQLRLDRGVPSQAADYLNLPGVVREGHFRLLSGSHSATFIAFSGIAKSSAALSTVCSWLLPSIAPWAPTAVLSPSTAGVSLSATIARELGVPLHLAGADDAGRPAGLLGDPDLGGERIAIVNDVVTTGTGLQALKDLVNTGRGLPVGAAWFLTRSELDAGALLELPTAAVGTLGLETFTPKECPLCADGTPLEDGLDMN